MLKGEGLQLVLRTRFAVWNLWLSLFRVRFLLLMFLKSSIIQIHPYLAIGQFLVPPLSPNISKPLKSSPHSGSLQRNQQSKSHPHNNWIQNCSQSHQQTSQFASSTAQSPPNNFSKFLSKRSPVHLSTHFKLLIVPNWQTRSWWISRATSAKVWKEWK